MKRGRLPLTALRSFEAAGRHLSFSRAAEELFVSQAAISRQVRELEGILGTPLFERRHRSVTLTQAGSALLLQLTKSFDEIAGGLSRIAGTPAQHVVTVTVEPSFAAAWLVPRLHRFNALRPDFDVSIDASPMVVDLRARGFDLAIRHGMEANAWPRTQARHLVDCTDTPLLAPTLLASGPSIVSPQDLTRYPLLHVDNRDGWSGWFSAAGLAIEPSRGPIFPDAALAAQSAVLGHGVVLGGSLLSGPDIEAGRLIAPFDLAVACGAYWLVAPEFDKLSQAAAAFAAWVAEEIAAGAEDPS